MGDSASVRTVAGIALRGAGYEVVEAAVWIVPLEAIPNLILSAR